MKSSWKFIKTNKVFENKYLSVRGDTFKTPEGKELEYYVVEGNPVVATLVINDKNEILFVNQFRPQINKYVTGIPGGSINIGEKTIDAAKRELLEETGYKARTLTKLHEFYFDPGRSDKKITIFITTNVSKKNIKIDKEIEKYKWIKVKKAIEGILNNNILDPVAQIAILTARLKKII